MTDEIPWATIRFRHDPDAIAYMLHSRPAWADIWTATTGGPVPQSQDVTLIHARTYGFSSRRSLHPGGETRQISALAERAIREVAATATAGGRVLDPAGAEVEIWIRARSWPAIPDVTTPRAEGQPLNILNLPIITAGPGRRPGYWVADLRAGALFVNPETPRQRALREIALQVRRDLADVCRWTGIAVWTAADIVFARYYAGDTRHAP